MADKCNGAVSMTPIVKVDPDLDGDGMDVIHHDIKKTLGGKLEYHALTPIGVARWFYNAASIISANADLIPGTDHADDKFTDGTSTATTDEIRFIFIKHLGHDGADPPVASIKGTDLVCFTFDAGDPATERDAICLDSGESIILKFRGDSANKSPDIATFHANKLGANVAVQFAAMIDDGA